MIDDVQVTRTGRKFRDPMLVEPYTQNELRIARVEQLTALYLGREPSEISPFDDKSADFNKFKESYENSI